MAFPCSSHGFEQQPPAGGSMTEMIMTTLRVLLARLSGVFTKGRAGSDLAAEIDAHLELLAQNQIDRGSSPVAARAAARREFGGVAQVKEIYCDQYGFAWIDACWQDLRLAGRSFARLLIQAPGFTVTAVGSLALGIAANTAMFSVIDTVLLTSFAYPHPERIVMFQNVLQRDGAGGTASPTEFNWWRQNSDVFEEVSAYSLFDAANLTGDGLSERIRTMRVSSDFFRLCGGAVLYGRFFSADDDLPHAPKTAVLAHAVWQRLFSGDSHVIGRRMTLDGEAYEIVGVARPGLSRGGLAEMMRGNGDVTIEGRPDVYVPFQLDPNSRDHGHYFNVAGRLKPGVTVAEANAYLRASYREYGLRWPDDVRGRAGFRVQPLQAAIVSGVRNSLLMLLAAVGVVLLIACANVANLLLARAAGRTREMAIRTALGAGRGRIVRQLLVESMILSLVAGVVGAAMGDRAIHAILTVSPGNIPRIGVDGSNVMLDWRVLAFTVAVSIATGILFGLVPALESSRKDLACALKESGNRTGAALRGNRTRALLITTETALAVLLLMMAALLIRSFIAIRQVKPGFDSGHVLTLRMALTGLRFENPEDLNRVIHEGLRRIRDLPGVDIAATASALPIDPPGRLTFRIAGRADDPASEGAANCTRVSAGYFETFKIPLVRGRAFTDRDEGGPPVVIVNETLARQLWPDGDPLNDRLTIAAGSGTGDERPRQIIGVVGDIRGYRLDREPIPTMYVLSGVGRLQMAPTAWAIRTRTASISLSAAIETELRTATEGIPVTNVRTMEELVSRATAAESFNALVLTTFGGTALLLAAIGIYGLVAYSVTQRTQELGIRLALGAASSQIRTMVVMQGVRPTLQGIGYGLVAGLASSRILGGFLFGVKAWDPLVFCAVPLLLFVVALVAVGVPAIRAGRIDPAAVLRSG
jgi:putative ABC transport system permease protein